MEDNKLAQILAKIEKYESMVSTIREKVEKTRKKYPKSAKLYGWQLQIATYEGLIREQRECETNRRNYLERKHKW